ncbi:MAG: ABC transporter ATP-binding protein [Gaiella sp.]
MIRAEGVTLRFDDEEVLRGVDLEVATGETLALLGPSGSGKTSLLRVVAGLTRPDAGRVLVDGSDVSDLPAHRRGVGLVFQQPLLFPHRDVAGNVGFGLDGWPRDEARQRIGELLELVGLPGIERRAVATLSGGEAQRVALARALAPRPRCLLLDEPLGALDGPLRDRLQDDLASLFASLGLTVVHVTHDVGEAFALGDRVAVLRDGAIAQVDAPEQLWRAPADAWVAEFLGSRNVVVLDGQQVVARPEAVRLHPGGDDVVETRQRRGPLVLLRVRRADGSVIEAATTALETPAVGDRVSVQIDPRGTARLPAADPAAGSS